MYGGSSKPGGRASGGGSGRGAGAAKLGRASFPPPHRSSAQTSRLSLGGGGGGSNPRSRNSASAASAAPAAVEEQFSLVAGHDPLAFSLIIRMTPDLVEEIKRVEAEGGKPRMKFGPLPNNPVGNVIELGGKEFKFTWSREFGDLCDIYEERESGEGGSGLLVESGCAWRRVNVQRILDESTQKHVKRLSEEAERKHKSRKSIVLEQNTAMKNQLKTFATSSANQPRRSFKPPKKEPPFKKQKVELPQAPAKSAYKTGLSSTATAKGRYSSSPLPSPPLIAGAPSSPFRNGNILKSHGSSAEDIVPFQGTSKDKPAPSSDKEVRIRTTTAVRETAGKGNDGANSTDLESILISLLMENPKGMSQKALEKAVGDSHPNSGKKVDQIIKKIANLRAPGKYVLKTGVELESSRKPLSESGSSPEEKLRRTPASDVNSDQMHVQAPCFEEKIPPNESEGQVRGQLDDTVAEVPNALIRIDNEQNSPDLFGVKGSSDNIQAQAGSSSDTGSDSDTDSDSSDTGSDSGSPSRSRSKSKSPAGSGSGSSSDSESDASSNSKEGSDEDVDIMTSDDDKEPKHMVEGLEPGFSTLPIPLQTPDGRRPVHSGNDEKQDEHQLDAVEVEMPDVDQDTVLVVASHSNHSRGEKPLEETNPCSPQHGELQEHQSLVHPLFGGETTVKDDFSYEQSDSSERLYKGKSKRSSEVKNSDEKSERKKRSKTNISHQPPASVAKDVHFPKASHIMSPDRLIDPVSQVISGADRVGDTESGSLNACSQEFSARYSSEFKQSRRKSLDPNPLANVSDPAERPDRYADGLGNGRKYSEKSSHIHESFPLQKDKFHRDTQNGDGYPNEKKVPKNAKEGGIRGKQSVRLDSPYQKPGDIAGKNNIRNGAAGSPNVNGSGNKLQREFSDLELGELREPFSEETTVKKQFERKSSFKQSGVQINTPENLVSDFSKVKTVGKANLDVGRPSSPDLSSKFPSNQEGSNKKKNYEDRIEDLSRSQQRVFQSQAQYPSRVDHPDMGRLLSKSVDISSKSRQNEGGGRQAICLDGLGESIKKATLTAPQQHDSKRGLVSHPTKESKRLASNLAGDSTDPRKNLMLEEGNDSDRKKRDSSSDENSCSYSKYDKNKPELKGPIKDFSQYEEYMQEYRDKYDSYCSLNKTLERYRNQFEKLGKDLEYARGTERYNNILGKLKESYLQCGTRHKKLKNIFVVLHGELKHLKQRMQDFADAYVKD